MEDVGVALIRLEGGITFVFKISWAMHLDTLGPLIFLGTRGGFNVTAQRLFHEYSGFRSHSDLQLPDVHRDFPPMYTYFKSIESFTNAIRNGGPNPVPGEEVIYSQAIIDGIYRSAASGR